MFQDKSSNRYRSSTYSSSTTATTVNSPSTAKPSISFSQQDLETIVKHVLPTSGIPFIALSVTLGTPSWYFDSAYCNHMTSDSSLFSSTTSASDIFVIHTVDGSHMHVSHIGHVSTPNISLPNTYFIPQLTLNLISIG